MHKQIYTELNNGVQMPLLGLGVYDMYNQEAIQTVSTALKIGYRLIDTAAMYENEVEIGKGIRQSGVDRNEIFLTTKVDNVSQGYDKTLQAFEESMKRLDCDYIDLYLIHWPIKATRKDTWKALEHLYNTKQVRAIGVANYLLPFLDELDTYNTIVPAINQVEFSPYLFQQPLMERCREEGIQLQASLVRGQRFNDERLITLSEKYYKTPAQIILRWAIQHNISTIPKSSSPIRLQENFQIFDFEISEEDMKKIDGFNENLRVVEDPLELL
ncbi:aldo/keto reductase [Arcicella aquatica]|uniref:Aldo/keto reductase n=1 Tax=Arcicella aquatica TaxID=217141 RepID=A0ABU5QU12_9BACT|nr:aldo/keto reductase [Arcicella aquatica]MEA5260591.1 aldo/keto reductase [Arcicella aquatica]